jgi:diguanylate cyclase (GGDEF)-like protein/PAS domain S-box-containing protein
MVIGSGEFMPAQARRILVVDDERHNRVLMEIALESKGYSPHCVPSGLAALEYLQDNSVDLVLLDIMMPEMDGYEVLEYLRQSHTPVELPIIMVTAKAASKDITHALNLGANDYVTKPVDLAVMHARIETQLSLHDAREALERSNERFDLAVQGTSDGIWDWNLENDQIYYSDRWKAIFGYRPNELEDHPDTWFTRVRSEDRDHLESCLDAHLEGRAPTLECEYRIKHKDGGYRWVLTRGSALFNEQGKAYRLVGAQTDITQNKDYDPQTGLFSRSLFEDRLHQQLNLCKDIQSLSGSVFLLGLDQFGFIRNSLGNMLEDELLIEIGKRLKSCIGADDCLARFGGDNFAILFPEHKTEDDVTSTVRRIRREMTLPFTFKDMEVIIHIGIGIVLVNGSIPDSKTVLRNAYAALDESKLAGKDQHRIFDDELHDRSMGLLRTESDLRKGIRDDEFLLYYQPIVSLSKKRVVACEALVRWNHPLHGFVMPSLFIKHAEATGLILELGDWVLKNACTQAKQWQDLGMHIQVAVNFSAHQFHQRNLVDKIMEVVEETQLDPQNLKIELTETALMEDIDRTIAILNKLRDRGILISLDDFGTGYSSLSYLKKFPIDNLKVDQSFIRDITTDRTDAAITAAIIQMARSLSMETISEGVETAEHMDFLRTIGCDMFQGYFVSKPQPAEQLMELLSCEYAYTV